MLILVGDPDEQSPARYAAPRRREAVLLRNRRTELTEERTVEYVI